MVRQDKTINISQDVQRVRNGKIVITIEVLNGEIISCKLSEDRRAADGK